MKILVTGAFGNVGTCTLYELSQLNHQVSAFDLKTHNNQKTARKWQSKLEKINWGDIRNAVDIQAAVKEQDVIFHLAAIIPPRTNKDPEYARQVNVDGMRNLIQSIIACGQKENRPKLIFTSSVSVHGYRKNLEPPVRSTDPIRPTDVYTHHKAECEQLLQEIKSEIDWTIFRLGVIPPVTLSAGFDPIMFEIQLDNRVEFAHGRDVGLALINAAKLAMESKTILHKIFLIGGGKQNGCQLSYRTFIWQILETFGVGKLREDAFGPNPYYTDWMDTTESQEYLQFQRFSYNDFCRDVMNNLGLKRNLIQMVRPIAKLYLYAQSPYLRNSRKKI